ncbi:MAG: hypothetical protein Aureis2KO_23810 [Aureisphaera sp.]
MKPQKIKDQLLNFCEQFVSQRKKQIQDQIGRIEESLFNEGKSTAGDKHHTGRAMLQLDRENAGKQLLAIENLELVLGKINMAQFPTHIALGTYFETTHGNYFMAISAGKMTLGETDCYCISPGTPIGKLFLGKKKGDTIHFNGKNMEVLALY